MIFVTLGSQKFQFNRLLIEIDRLIKEGIIKERVFAQIGYSDYLPENYGYKDFLGREEFLEVMKKSTLVITHGGTGAIITAVKAGKKVIAVSRMAKYGEHVDDHQLQLINQFSEMELIIPCYDTSDLKEAYQKIKNKKIVNYRSNTSRYLEEIEKFINE